MPLVDVRKLSELERAPFLGEERIWVLRAHPFQAVNKGLGRVIMAAFIAAGCLVVAPTMLAARVPMGALICLVIALVFGGVGAKEWLEMTSLREQLRHTEFFMTRTHVGLDNGVKCHVIPIAAIVDVIVTKKRSELWFHHMSLTLLGDDGPPTVVDATTDLASLPARHLVLADYAFRHADLQAIATRVEEARRAATVGAPLPSSG